MGEKMPWREREKERERDEETKRQREEEGVCKEKIVELRMKLILAQYKV